MWSLKKKLNGRTRFVVGGDTNTLLLVVNEVILNSVARNKKVSCGVFFYQIIAWFRNADKSRRINRELRDFVTWIRFHIARSDKYQPFAICYFRVFDFSFFFRCRQRRRISRHPYWKRSLFALQQYSLYPLLSCLMPASHLILATNQQFMPDTWRICPPCLPHSMSVCVCIYVEPLSIDTSTISFGVGISIPLHMLRKWH